jgi:hypothetical protein
MPEIKAIDIKHNNIVGPLYCVGCVERLNCDDMVRKKYDRCSCIISLTWTTSKVVSYGVDCQGSISVWSSNNNVSCFSENWRPLKRIFPRIHNVQGGAEKRENLKSLEKHERSFKTLFAPETVFYKSGNFIKIKKNKKIHGLSPRANYTDRATATCRRRDCQLVRIEGATWSAWRIPPAVFLGFLDRSRYFSIK